MSGPTGCCKTDISSRGMETSASILHKSLCNGVCGGKLNALLFSDILGLQVLNHPTSNNLM